MKTGVVSLFAGILLLAACDAPEHTIESQKQVGVLIFGDARYPQSNGFLDGLKTFGWEDTKNMKVHILNAKHQKKQLGVLVDQLVKEQPDLLVAAGGLEAEAIKLNTNRQSIPTVVLYINAIIERQFIQDRRNPGWEVTGVDNLNFELSGKRVELLHDLIPEIRKILILYYKDIEPSVLGVKNAREQADKLNIQIDAREVKSRNEIQQVMASLKPGEVDAMLTVPAAPIDNAIKDIVLPEVNRLSIPLMTHSRKMTVDGALASYGAPSFAMGKQAARFADKIFKGNKASSMPFETPSDFKFSVNKKVLQRLRILPSSLAASQINEYIE